MMMNGIGTGMGGPVEMEDDFALDAPPRMIGDEISMFGESVHEYVRHSQRLAENSSALIRYLQHTRESYNNAVRERDILYEQLKGKVEKLGKCEATLQRYECAADPVVGSDGYTYERQDLESYIEDCKSKNEPAFSNQTREEMTSQMISNHSLVSLTKELMQAINPEYNVVPEYHARTIIDSYTAISNINRGGGGGAMEGENNFQSATSKLINNHMNGAGPNSTHSNTNNNSSNVALTNTNNSRNRAATDRGGAGQVRLDGRGLNTGRRFDSKNAAEVEGLLEDGSAKPERHPCLRIYRCCNFKNDCTFAKYPYDACLNFIKGKCRFGAQCKELHVDRDDPRYINTRSTASPQRPRQEKQRAASDGANTEATGSPIENVEGVDSAASAPAQSTEK